MKNSRRRHSENKGAMIQPSAVEASSQSESINDCSCIVELSIKWAYIGIIRLRSDGYYTGVYVVLLDES